MMLRHWAVRGQFVSRVYLRIQLSDCLQISNTTPLGGLVVPFGVYIKARNKGIPVVRDNPFCRRTTQYQSQNCCRTTSQKLIKIYINKQIVSVHGTLTCLTPKISRRFAGIHQLLF